MNKKRTYYQRIGIFTLTLLLYEMLFPITTYALTGGPSQPEVESFQPMDANDFVDPFTGSFNYNIPLIDVDGYSLNLGYDGSVTMDEEASWVGLGWNLNPGVINRNMRGIPDDFKGDEVITKMNIKENVTVGANVGVGTELFGFDKLKLSGGVGASFNNYNGISFESNFSLSRSLLSTKNSGMGGSIGLSRNSHDGITTDYNLSLSANGKLKDRIGNGFGVNIGSSFNSRAGLQYLTMSPKLPLPKGSSVGFNVANALPTYTPSIEMPMKYSSYSFNLSAGAFIQGPEVTGDVRGYYSKQRLERSKIKTPAYGYLYHEKGQKNHGAMLDFNREKDGGFSKNTPALPLTNHTYDTYTIAAQGIGGAFRPYRGGHAYVFDAKSRSGSLGLSGGGEFAISSIVKVGVDITVSPTRSESGLWKNDNELRSVLSPVEIPPGSYFELLTNKGLASRYNLNNRPPLHEEVFFKSNTENMTLSHREEFYASSGNTNPIVPLIFERGRFDTEVKESYFEYNERLSPSHHAINQDNNHLHYRERRNTSISYLTRDELYASGLEVHPNAYRGEGHHIAEFTVTNTDGTRYIFGLPAYNTEKEEVTFNVGSTGDCQTGLVDYVAGVDNSRKNKQGTDNYYKSVSTPPYAHAYMLTAILGPGYSDVDIGERGPTPNDLGHYVKFNYDKTISDYKWRTPYKKANYEEGLIPLNGDRKGNFTYGKKEVWYLNTIETRNYVVLFSTSSRKDALETLSRDGGKGVQSLHKLDKIAVYSRPDYKKHSNNLDDAIPIKTVHFEYDYSLCEGVPNHSNYGGSQNTGKLTLKKVYFTYGSSNRGRLNAYEFSYSNFNPNYDLKAYDRWGNYLPNEPTSCNVFYTEKLPNAYFPYTPQDPTLVDDYSSAWLMDEISLPSGGKILIDYESNDYAYVQDQRANQMFKITSVTNTKNPVNPAGPGSSSLLYSNDNPNNYIFFELKEPKSSSEFSEQQFRKDYIGSIKYLYFRVLARFKSANSYDFVSGYAEFDKEEGVISAGLYEDNGLYTHGWVKVKSVYVGRFDQQKVNPIQRAAIQFGRIYLKEHVYGLPNSEDFLGDQGYLGNAIKAFVNSSYLINPTGFKQLFMEPNWYLFSENIGNAILNNKSWIRLKSPDKFKIGGGARVKRVRISDEWENMATSGTTFYYGKEYDYTKIDEKTGNTISSGVAAYEPPIGSDENPLKQPVFFGDAQEKLLLPNDINYLEEPFGESFFPAPTIGYSQITVTDLKYENVTRRATGRTVHQFYTAKDFPVITDRTPLRIFPQVKEPIIKIFYSSSKSYMTASQGFSIEVNDMHGKPRKVTQYAEGKKGHQYNNQTEYIYQKKMHRSGSYIVDNSVQVVYPDGSIEEEEMGVDIDIVNDFREFYSEAKSISAEYNVGAIFVVIASIPIPAIFPAYQKSETRFRSAGTTKVINKKGILREVRQHDLGANVKTVNKAYDALSGEVILIRSNNNYEDPVYTLTYPAHWYYTEMGPSYKNIHHTENVEFNNGKANIVNAIDKFHEGDKIIFIGKIGDVEAWVTEVGEDFIKAVNYVNNPVHDDKGRIKVVSPGRKNLQSQSMGKIVSLNNPLDGLKNNVFTNVLEAEATVFTDKWDIPCDCFNELGTNLLPTSNPYVVGLRGNWLQERQYLYLTDRQLTHQDNQSNMRSDGVFETFSPFWRLNDGSWNKNNNNWVWTSSITDISAFGNPLEAIDPLERYTSQLFGYNNRLVTASVHNSMYRKSGFDGFEDYDFNNCYDNHKNFRLHFSKITEDAAHTGLRSIIAGPDENSIHARYFLYLCQ